MSVPGYSPGFKAPGLYIREDRAVGPSNGRNLVKVIWLFGPGSLKLRIFAVPAIEIHVNVS